MDAACQACFNPRFEEPTRIVNIGFVMLKLGPTRRSHRTEFLWNPGPAPQVRLAAAAVLLRLLPVRGREIEGAPARVSAGASYCAATVLKYVTT